MDLKRPIQVGMSSSLIDLKAEVLKKQAELQASKSKQQGVQKSLKKSELLNSKAALQPKNPGIEKRIKRDLEKQAEEEKTLEKSKSILEEKAKLYDKMTSEALDHDESEHPVLANSLVNFTQKAIDHIKESRERPSASVPIMFDNDDVDESAFDYNVDEEEWTEFTDALGRTRRCLKTDLPSFISRDEEFSRPSNPGICLSREAEEKLIEMKRDKWDQDAEEAAKKDKVHYQDVLYDEIRTHGVGFYNFSKDEQERSHQLDELKRISTETGEIRNKLMKERSEKKSALKERLAKIRAKKRAKLGLPVEPEPDEKEKDDSEDDNDTTEKEDKSDDEGRKSPKQMRPWDFGKAGVYGPRPTTFDELDEKWLRDRRSDRKSEFAPPSIYSSRYRGGHSSSSSSSTPKYSNFVKSSEQKSSHGPPPAYKLSAVPPPPAPKPLPFQVPQNFWKPQQKLSSSQSLKPLPIPILDEMSGPPPPRPSFLSKPPPSPEEDSSYERKRGTEIAPPPTFDYYHGGNTGTGKAKSTNSDPGIVADAVSSGLKALRERFDADQKRKQSMERKKGLDFED